MITDFLTGNIIYSKYIERWRFLYNSYIGGQEYRDAGYLSKYQLETDTEYRARCLETPLDNHCKSIVHIYNSFLFRECPERDFGILENMPDVESFMKDADMDGQCLDNFMKQVSIWSQVFGHCWIILSKPNVNAQSLAEEQLLGIRPYANILTPLAVLDWSWTRNVAGKYELSYFKYIEDINGSEHIIKEWTQNDIKTTIYDANTRETIDEIIELNGIGIIPAVISYSSRSIIRGIGSSAIDDICDLQRYEYNALSEAAQSIRLDSHPSLVATSDTQISTGAGSIITVPDNIPGDLKPYILDFNGASIQSIATLIDKTIAAIDKAACVEGVRSKETRTVSGVALETEFQTLNAMLNNISSNLCDAECKMWEIFCLYQQYPMCEIEVKYPQSFDIKDDDRELDQLVKVKSAATDMRVLQAVDMELLDYLDLDEDEIMALNNPNIINPNSLPSEEDYVLFEPCQMINQDGNIVMANSPEEQLQYAQQGYVKMD